MIALVMIPLLGFLGLAVDAGRGYLVKARLGDALDAAALAGAQVVFDDVQFQHDVEMYFYANFPRGFMGANPVLNPPVMDAAKETITLSASASIGTTFTRLIGYETLNVASSTEVTRLTTSMDVVLSVDMSGSMTGSDGAGGTRIAAARTAANTLIDILYGAQTATPLLQVGVVPWNSKVNVLLNGTTHDPSGNTVIGGLHYVSNSPVPLKSTPVPDWRGCVYARYTNNGTADDADDLLGLVVVGGVDWLGWDPIGPEGEPSSSTSCQGSGAGGRCPCLSHGITPLAKLKSDVAAAIDELTSPVGPTNIAQGLAWAWRVLMPGEPFDEADPFPKGRHQRAIVLLTDGEQFGYPGDAYRAAFGTGTAAGPAGMDDRLRAVAESFKDQGVEIYTIQFANGSGPLAALMADIASGPAAPYYHFAPDGDALNQIFTEIANHLSELRLSK
jgi:Flp pilus assembly protein TadG